MRNHALAHHPVAVRHPRRQSSGARLLKVVFDRSLLLPVGATIALIWANTDAESYFRFSHTFSFFVNEVGMAFFFALITQEIIEAMMPGGALHSWRRWAMPIVAAAGGVLGSALLYVGYVQMQYELLLAPAWPIACAIDIAAAYYVLKAICPRSGALPFVLLLAIATDVFGLVVVVPRHAVIETQPGGTVLILLALGLAALMRAWKVRAFWPYLAIGGTVSWWAFYWTGLHPALALVPIVPFLPHEPRSLDLFADPPDDDATHHFEHEWNTLVQVVLFFFGLVNAGVVMRAYGTGTWAVLAGGLVGRPLGILVAVWIAIGAGLHLPRRIRWRELVVIALATSSGFTFGLFFATGLFPIGPALNEIKIGALASAIGVVITFVAARWLRVGKFAPYRAAGSSVS